MVEWDLFIIHILVEEITDFFIKHFIISIWLDVKELGYRYDDPTKTKHVGRWGYEYVSMKTCTNSLFMAFDCGTIATVC